MENVNITSTAVMDNKALHADLVLRQQWVLSQIGEDEGQTPATLTHLWLGEAADHFVGTGKLEDMLIHLLATAGHTLRGVVVHTLQQLFHSPAM